jgi:hypothetical protein
MPNMWDEGDDQVENKDQVKGDEAELGPVDDDSEA